MQGDRVGSGEVGALYAHGGDPDAAAAAAAQHGQWNDDHETALPSAGERVGVVYGQQHEEEEDGITSWGTSGSGSRTAQAEAAAAAGLSRSRSARRGATTIEQLRRAASMREGGQTSTSNGSPGGPLERVARLGLERSASDAARRLAMAKLTGERIVAYVRAESTQGLAVFYIGPLPSLAELQARHEQRLAMNSPAPASPAHQVTSGSEGMRSSPVRNADTGDVHDTLHRSASNASARSANQPMFTAAFVTSPPAAAAGGATPSSHSHSASLSSSLNGAVSAVAGAEGTPALSRATSVKREDMQDEDAQKRNEERQEARSNLIRKLSRGRLAAGAAAAARERAQHNQAAAAPPSPALDVQAGAVSAENIHSPRSTEAPPWTAAPATGLARRPSLADFLARAEARRANAAAQPEVPLPLPFTQPLPATTAAYTHSGSQEHSAALSSSSMHDSATDPSDGPSPSADQGANGVYDALDSPSVYSPFSTVRGGMAGISGLSSVHPASTQGQLDVPTDESNRARSDNGDHFEFDGPVNESGFGGVSDHAPSLGEKPASPRSESLADSLPPSLPSKPSTENTPPSLPSKDGLASPAKTTFSSPPESPLDAVMLPGRQKQATNLLAAATAFAQLHERPQIPAAPLPPVPVTAERLAESLPETPNTSSPPLSAFPLSSSSGQTSYHAVPGSSQLQRLVEQEMKRQPEILVTGNSKSVAKPEWPTAPTPEQVPPHHPAPFSFLRQNRHEPHFSTDSFPVSVDPESSQASRKPSMVPPTQEWTARTELEVQNAQPSTESQAGPSSEYRFPTPASQHTAESDIKPPQRIAPSTSIDGLSDSMNRMIDQLEALQASEGKRFTNRTSAFPPTSDAVSTRATHEDVDRSLTALAEAAPGTSHSAESDGQRLVNRYDIVEHARTAIKDRTEGPSVGATHELRGVSGQNAGAASAARLSENETFTFGNQHHKKQASGAAKAYINSMIIGGDKRSGTAGGDDDEEQASARRSQSSSSSASTRESPDSSEVHARSIQAIQEERQARTRVLERLSDVLSAYAQPKRRENPLTQSRLNTPPRQLLLHTAVLQVVNANTVKDRYLFLFTDMLVIAKPLIEEDAAGDPIFPRLDTRFLVKSIVELPKLKLTAQANDVSEETTQKKKHPLLLNFVDRFANDPKKAIASLVAKAGLPNDATTIANLLFRNPELNRSQLGAYLAAREQKHVLKAFCERFRLSGIRIEDALRVFLSSLRLPNDYAAAEYLLGVFASQWLASNPGTGMTNDSVFATKLVISIMELNDALHSGIDDETAAAGNLFSFPNHAITVDDFIAAFRLKDPHGSLPDEHLTRIYLAIRKDRLQQAADNSIASISPEVEVLLHPAKLPNRLTYRTASENITVTIPKVDRNFSIKLVGQDLRFEPPVLTFARSRSATFRITPTALGAKAVLFIRLGANANMYRNLPINKTFSVERAFMSHTFQVAFVNHLNVKRKYLFSLCSADAKFTWVDTLRQRIESAPIQQESTPRAAKLGEAVALQVLRDALIAPDEPAPALLNKNLVTGPASRLHTPPNSRGGLRSAAGVLQRSNSFSKTYTHGIGRAEADLANERRPSSGQAVNPGLGSFAGLAIAAAQNGVNNAFSGLGLLGGGVSNDKKQQQQQQSSAATTGAGSLSRHGSNAGADAPTTSATHPPFSKTGHEIVTTVEQNSLMPLVLGFVSAGAGVDAMPRKPVVPDTVAKQVTPPQARGTGRFRGL